MPDAFELPGMLGAVVPLVGGEGLPGLRRNVIGELVALAFGHSVRRFGFARGRAGLEPGFAAVVGALNDLPEPAARLRAVDAIGIHGRTLEVIDLPAGEMRAADLPIFAFAVGRKNECTLARAHQDSNFAHVLLLLVIAIFVRAIWSVQFSFEDSGNLSYSKTGRAHAA